MTEIKKNERFIPIKNYVISVIIIIATIFLAFYGFEWYKVIKENKISTSYLIKEKIISQEITEIDEIESIFSEVPKNYFIYISYTGNQDIYNMEKKLAKTINEYDLNDTFYYINVTKIKDEDDLIDKLNKKLDLKDLKIKKIPTIIYYKDGEEAYIINSNSKIMQIDDFYHLIDVNHITK